MRQRPMLSVALLAACTLTAVACRGAVADTKSKIVGTWTREHDGKFVQEITYTPDGKFDSVNPQTGGAREQGTYSVGADGTSVTFVGTDVSSNTSTTYTCRVRFKSKDEFTWE